MTSLDGRLVAVAGTTDGLAEATQALRDRGVTVVAGAVPADAAVLLVPQDASLDDPLVREADRLGVEVIGEVELAWRLRQDDAAPWLVLAGTHGTGVAARMLSEILAAAGKDVRTGSLLEQVLSPGAPDVLVVPVSSRQLHWSSSLRPSVGCLLNLADLADLAEDPEEVSADSAWHGSFPDYTAAQGRVLDADTSVGSADDDLVRALHERAPGRCVAFSLRSPRPGELGVVEDLLVDRAYPEVLGEATALATLHDVRLPGDHHVAYALAAAAMARAVGVPASAVAEGLRAVVPDPS